MNFLVCYDDIPERVDAERLGGCIYRLNNYDMSENFLPCERPDPSKQRG